MLPWTWDFLWESFFPNNSNLCQLDNKLTRTATLYQEAQWGTRTCVLFPTCFPVRWMCISGTRFLMIFRLLPNVPSAMSHRELPVSCPGQWRRPREGQTWAVREDDNLKHSVFRTCLRVTIAAMKHNGQRNMERKGFIQLMSPRHKFIIKGNQNRNSSKARPWRQELMQNLWGRAAYCPILLDLLSLCFFIKPNVAIPGKALPIMGWALLYQPLIRKLFHRLAHSLIIWRHFLNRSSLLSDNSNLCQVDIMLASEGVSVTTQKLMRKEG